MKTLSKDHHKKEKLIRRYN